MPFGLTGIATIAYEIIHQLGTVPGTLIAPVGHGGLLYGIMLGFEVLLGSGVSKALPYYIGVQAENCAPVLQAYKNDSIEVADGSQSQQWRKVPAFPGRCERGRFSRDWYQTEVKFRVAAKTNCSTSIQRLRDPACFANPLPVYP